MRKFPHPSNTKYGTPVGPVPKQGNPSMRKFPHPSITKYGTPVGTLPKLRK